MYPVMLIRVQGSSPGSLLLFQFSSVWCRNEHGQDGYAAILIIISFLCFRMNSGAFLSTGFFTMILAMDICDSIHVYGMIDDNFCR